MKNLAPVLPIIRSHHQDYQVGNLGAPGPHGGESFMSGGVQKDYLPLALGQFHMVSPDVLGNATGLFCRYFCISDIIKQ